MRHRPRTSSRIITIPRTNRTAHVAWPLAPLGPPGTGTGRAARPCRDPGAAPIRNRPLSGRWAGIAPKGSQKPEPPRRGEAPKARAAHGARGVGASPPLGPGSTDTPQSVRGTWAPLPLPLPPSWSGLTRPSQAHEAPTSLPVQSHSDAPKMPERLTAHGLFPRSVRAAFAPVGQRAHPATPTPRGNFWRTILFSSACTAARRTA